MDIKRNLLLTALAVVSYFMLLAWNQDYPADTASDAGSANNPAVTISEQAVDLPDSVNTAAPEDSNDLPAVPQASEVSAAPAETETETEVLPSSRLITVNTPKQIVTIDLLGGDIVGVSLPEFPVSLETPDDPFALLRQDSGMVYVAQSGLIGRDGPDASGQGRPLYVADVTAGSPEGDQSVTLRYTTPGGVQIAKSFDFSSDDYLIGVRYQITNNSGSPFQANMFGQIKRDNSPEPSTSGGISRRTFLGAAVNTQDDPYVKMDFDDIDDGVDPIENTGGWIAFSQHYFLGSWIPDSNTDNTFTMRRNNQGDYLLTFVNPPLIVQPGETGNIDAGFWAGPKDQYRLQEIATDLDKTIDYGKFFVIASPIFWLLTQINNLVGNYGVAIILLTIIIKTLLFPLSAKSLVSMAKMRRLTPKINALKDQYGDDKQGLMQAQMELWKKEKVNPFGGCLPMLLQIPVFLGIYWVLIESVELRQAPFILWYEDLSKMDPYFVLPMLMAAAMFVQQTITPMQTADPAQAKMFKFMPLFFAIFFLWFPAGLVLYYTVNSVLSILQQWVITKQIEKTYKPKGT